VGVRLASFGLLADVVSTLQSFVIVFVLVYALVIFAYVLASLVRLPYSFNPVLRFLNDVCEPYLRLFRRFLPTVGPLDFSPFVAVIVLFGAEQLVVRVLDQLH
jgi:YggT family protein